MSHDIWFTSDLHFDHRRIVEFTDRGVATTIENHTEWLVDLWNTSVKPGDVVCHLGDFSFNKNAKEIELTVAKLNGSKHFIKGNHCDARIYRDMKNQGLLADFRDYKEIRVGKQSIILFHFPIMSWHKQGYGSWHLHGHCHGNLITPRGKMLDVGLDNSYNLYGEHKLFHYDEIESFMKEQDIYIADHHKDRSME